MSAKKNLPNIPIYIGDWERDCNVLCLESEAAWMRIVFKLWTKGKQNSIKIPSKSLQNLWRCNPEKMQEIIDDLTYNDICPISVDKGFVTFTCRRFVKENKISKIRSEAGKSKKKDAKDESKPNQTEIKKEQNTDIDYDNANDFASKTKNASEENKLSQKETFDLPEDETPSPDIFPQFGEDQLPTIETDGMKLWAYYLDIGQFQYSYSSYKGIFELGLAKYGYEKMKKVIELKIFQANKGDIQRNWLAPSTIFRPEKLEKYVNEVNDIEAGRTNPNKSKGKKTKADIIAENNKKRRELEEMGF